MMKNENLGLNYTGYSVQSMNDVDKLEREERRDRSEQKLQFERLIHPSCSLVDFINYDLSVW